MFKRNPSSSKGQNGRVCIVGGSETFHGAPILSSLAVEATGVDLIFPVVSPLHAEVTKQASYNFICHFFKQPNLTLVDQNMIDQALRKSDVLVIGPGLGDKRSTLNTVFEVLKSVSIPVVIDASALEVVKRCLERDNFLSSKTIITPHRGEFEFITGRKLKGKVGQDKYIVQDLALKLGVVVVVKGEQDIVADSEGNIFINSTGNAGMTVGGTGDVLAGVIGGLVAQKVKLFEAAKLAVKVVGRCGERLFLKKGYAYTAQEVVEMIPVMMK
jgi:NAD(P)H-hydrate epimerase